MRLRWEPLNAFPGGRAATRAINKFIQKRRPLLPDANRAKIARPRGISKRCEGCVKEIRGYRRITSPLSNPVVI